MDNDKQELIRMLLKIKQWFFFRKVRKIDFDNLVKNQKWIEEHPCSRSSFSLKHEVMHDFQK